MPAPIPSSSIGIYAGHGAGTPVAKLIEQARTSCLHPVRDGLRELPRALIQGEAGASHPLSSGLRALFWPRWKTALGTSCDHPLSRRWPVFGRRAPSVIPGGIVSHKICIEESIVKKIICILLGVGAGRRWWPSPPWVSPSIQQ